MFLVATEDQLSEAVARRLVAEARDTKDEIRCVRKGGAGYLKGTLRKFAEAAQRCPVLVLTDLDRVGCAPALVTNWAEGIRMPPRLVFRVAVREIETWLLADREAVARFLGVSTMRIERNPETIPDPKRYLLALAEKSPRQLRNDLLPTKGAAASQGFGYNARLCEFVESGWSPDRAAESSSSLRRAIERIDDCAANFPDIVRG
jgi:hypothetical protein